MRHIISIAGIILLTAYSWNEFPGRPSARYEVHGIDVSHHQSHINWDSVVTHQIDFVFVKATEGITLYDSLFGKNWQEIRRVGLKRGAYHFFRPSFPPADQADNFIKNVPMEWGDIPPVLDVEVLDGVSKAELLVGVYTWLYRIEIAYGVKPIIYTSQKFYNNYLAGHFDEYPLWIARYSAREPNLQDDRDWLFWQYGNTGQIRGVDGNVDFNVFTGSYEDLELLCLQPRRVLSMR